MPTAVVTGANRGIGLEFVRQLLCGGWGVFAACRSSSEALTSLGPKHFFTADVRHQPKVNSIFSSLDSPIGLLINNAEVSDGRWMTFDDVEGMLHLMCCDGDEPHGQH
ncbi:MAG: SDR family NAD(P)-dependent oxidoreductase [archaeon]|nr:SDR family NAD(P)-dependent oxidoreductase [archaeon]